MHAMKMAAAVAVLGLAFAGCGEAESGRLQTVSISEGKGGGTELFEAMMAAQEEVGSFAFEMTFEAAGMQFSGDGAGEVGDDPAESDMTMTIQVPDMGEMSMLLVDGQLFMSLPPEAGLPIDTPWLTIDPEGDDPVSEAFGQSMDDLISSMDMQGKFAEHAKNIAVEEGGTDTLDGVEVSEYLLTIEPEDVGAFLESTGQEFDAAELPDKATTTSLWLDSDALPRKMTTDMAESGSMEFRWFDYGEPVEVEAPPEDEVTDLSSLMNQ